MTKPSIPQGTRDFSAETLKKRNFIFRTIKEVFELYGFQPLETPAMENLDTLMGKYGEEGDKLIFRILNNGLDDPKNEMKAKEGFQQLLQGKSSKELTERALKYDLTIPFARYVAMNHGQLTFPYKRYQIQPVWRADRPQKGRYREFTQCDADVVGSVSLLHEVEFANIYHSVFEKLGITPSRIHINSRKILAALAEQCGGADKLIMISNIIDKLEKIGIEKVKAELIQKGLQNEQIEVIEKYLTLQGSNEDKLAGLKALLKNSQLAEEGTKDLQFVQKLCGNAGIIIDFTLARGLNYYTGIIFEAKAPESIKMGSIGGGGRYDDLTGLFGVPGIPGVGISFGVDRIYDVMEEMNLFPAQLETGTRVLFFNLGEKESLFAFQQVQRFRENGIASELFHEQAKMDKQFRYADKKNIPYVIIIGSKEMDKEEAVIKELSSGEQNTRPIKDLIDFFRIQSS